MTGPGVYEPDPLTGIIDPEKLPKPKIKNVSRLRKKCRGPQCSRLATRHGTRTRALHHLGDLDSGRPVDVRLTFSTHYCCKCHKKFHVDTSDIVAPRAEYTNAVVELAVRLVVEDQLPFRRANAHLWRNDRVLVPYKTIANWVDDAGKKLEKIETDEYFRLALANYSGYISIDEVYDEKNCILFLDDARTDCGKKWGDHCWKIFRLR